MGIFKPKARKGSRVSEVLHADGRVQQLDKRRTLSGKLIDKDRDKPDWFRHAPASNRVQQDPNHPSRKHDTDLRVVPTSIEVTHAEKGAPRRRVRRQAARVAARTASH